MPCTPTTALRGPTTQVTDTSQHASETTRAAGDDTSGLITDVAMTRSEERVEVGTRSQEVGRARLRKYVVTEQVTKTVPVTRERAVLETEPITDVNVGAATDGPEISEEEHEVVLHEEVAVVEKVVEPVERVRLGTEEVVGGADCHRRSPQGEDRDRGRHRQRHRPVTPRLQHRLLKDQTTSARTAMVSADRRAPMA